MNLNKNEQKFKERFDKILGNSFYLTPFLYSERLNVPIELECKVCGLKQSKLFYNLFKSNTCRSCRAKVSAENLHKDKWLTKEQFISMLPSDVSYEVLSEKVNLNRKIKVKDRFGICEIQGRSLLKGTVPSLINAVDRNSYRINCYREVHGDNFTYPNYNYTSNNAKLEIICNRCGKYDVIIECNHMKKKTGCKNCDTTIGAPPLTSEEFMLRVTTLSPEIEILEEYSGYHSKITFRNKYGLCEGDAGHILRGFSGSLRSALDKTSYMIEQFKERHDNKYTYNRYEYCGNRCIGIITCPTHGDFEQLTDVHLMGSGCSKCGQENRVNGFGRTDFISMASGRICTYYIIKCINKKESFYKMGITARGVKSRYSSKYDMPYKYEIIFEYQSNDAAMIWDKELLVKQTYKPFRQEPLKYFKGSTECFNLEVPIEEIKSIFLTDNQK